MVSVEFSESPADDFIIGDRDVDTDENGARHSKSFNVLWSHRQDAKCRQTGALLHFVTITCLFFP